MKIYLDNCSLQRPLDDQSQPRIERETEAIIEILSFCEAGILTLISSEVLQTEINEISDFERKEASFGILEIARETVAVDSEIESRAKEFEKFGVRPFDALHLASAEAGNAEYFCTCDDKLLKKAKMRSDLKLKAVSPIKLLEEIVK
ncbi:MAG: PIN domain-containing protein [Pyrinomonadaceae bacterium]